MDQNKTFEKRSLKAEALSSLRKGDIEAAIAKYKLYLELNPDDSDAWAGLGGALRRKGDLESSINCYEKAYQIDSNSSYALVNLIALSQAKGTDSDLEKVKKYLPVALNLIEHLIATGAATYWSWYDFAILYLIQGDVEKTVETFNYATELTPGTAKENFLSVKNQLLFLQGHEINPDLIQRLLGILERKSSEESSIQQSFTNELRQVQETEFKNENEEKKMNSFNYINDRLEPQRTWHSQKAKWNKSKYYLTEVILLISSALIPIINIIEGIPNHWVRLFSALLAGIAVISSGISKLYKFRDNWLTYRSVAESLQQEKELFRNEVGDYNNTNRNREKMLVERVENIIGSATESYISTHRIEQTRFQQK